MKKIFLGLFSLIIASVLISPVLGQNTDFELFNKGDNLKYYTKDHPKAKGLNISIEYPKNWVAKEGERPNIVQKFSGSVDKYGISSICMILILDSPYKSDAEFERDIPSVQGLNAMVPPGAIFMNGGHTKYDGQSGLWITYSAITERAGLSLKAYSMSQMFYFAGKIVTIISTTGGPKEYDNVIYSTFRQNLPLFQLIGNSVIIHDKWGKSGTSGTSGISGTTSSPPALNDIFGYPLWPDLVLFFLITWSVGLVPPLLIRFLVVKKALSKAWSIGLAILFYMLNLTLFTALGSQSKTHFALLLVAWVSYYILIKENKVREG